MSKQQAITKVGVSEVKLSNLTQGVKELASAVKKTMGPQGQYVALETMGTFPVVTKDGVSVAKSITLEEPIQNMGAAMVRMAAEKAAEKSGDGTTTTVVLTEAILKAYATSGLTSSEAREQLDADLKTALHIIDQNTIQIEGDNEKVAQIATISANNDPVAGEIIAEAFSMAGESGIVKVEPSRSAETTLDSTNGYQFNRGHLSRTFVTDQGRGEAKVTDCKTLVTADEITEVDQIAGPMRYAIQQGFGFAVIAKDIKPMVLQYMEGEVMRNGCRVVAVQAPEFGELMEEMLKDIISVVGGKLWLKSEPEAYGADELMGHAESVIVSKDTTIVSGMDSEESIEARVEEIQEQLDSDSTTIPPVVLTDRIAKLGGGIVTISVGAATEVEMKEAFDRYEDAIRATQTALSQGVVAGGGITLVNVATEREILDADYLDAFEESCGTLLDEACLAPFKTIADNAGVDNALEDLYKTFPLSCDTLGIEERPHYGRSYGLNFKTGEWGDLIEMGVIDPAGVTKEALKAAVSVASMIISTGASVTFKRG